MLCYGNKTLGDHLFCSVHFDFLIECFNAIYSYFFSSKFYRVENSVYALLRTRDMAISRYREFGIPVEWLLDSGIVGKVWFKLKENKYISGRLRDKVSVRVCWASACSCMPENACMSCASEY